MANEIDEQKKMQPIAMPGSVATPPLQAPATLDNPKVIDRTLRPIATPATVSTPPLQAPAQLVNPQAEPLNPEDKALSDYINMLKEQQRTSEEEMKKQRKRMQAQKARDMITSIGRGLSAMANLYHTTKGAPHGQAFDNSTMQQRYDRMMADYKANKDKIDNLRLQIGDLTYRGAVARYSRNQAEEQRRQEQENKQRQLALAENEDKRKQAKAEADLLLTQGKITEQEHKNRLTAIELKYAPDKHKADISLKKAQTAREYAQTNKVNNESKKQVYGYVRNEYGENVAYYDQRSYEKAIEEAIQGGWMEYGDDVVTTTETVEKNSITGKDETKVQTTRKPGTPIDKKDYVYKTRPAPKQSPGQAKRAQQQKSQQKRMPGTPTQN